MHEGFVNYNAGTLGTSMVEGRISAGVVVGDGSDVGGSASIMGTLSGGGTEVISVGERCLLGANSGLGISLGDDCTVEAGLYVTAGTKVVTPDGEVVKAGDAERRRRAAVPPQLADGRRRGAPALGQLVRPERRAARQRLTPGFAPRATRAREPGPLRRVPLSRSAAEQAALIRDGRLSARELVDASLAAIERDDPQRVRAHLPRARAGGGRRGRSPATRARWPASRSRSRTSSCSRRGCATTNGSRSLGDWAPDVDSAPVARLRAAGAIVVGKTNTPEWGARPVTEPERYGPARNPHDPRADHGRLLGRQRRRGRGRPGRARARQRRRRLDPDPGLLLRRRRAQADPLPGPARAGAGRLRGLRRRRRAHPHGARHRARARPAGRRRARRRRSARRCRGPRSRRRPRCSRRTRCGSACARPRRAGRRSSPSASPPPTTPPGCSRRSGTRSTSGRPTGRTRSSRVTGRRPAARCSAR